jgi:hypothetical protein
MFLPLLLGLAVLGQSQDAQQAYRLSQSVVIDINLDKLKGKLVRQLAWSPDKSQLYLMTCDENRDASIKEVFHYVIRVDDGVPKKMEAPPEWATAYWAWKSAQTAPGEPALKLDASDEQRRENAVALPFGGDYAKGGTGSQDPAAGTSSGAAMEASRGMKTYTAYMIKLKNEVVGEWINHPIVPGLTYGWGPKGSGMIAFAEQKTGRLVLMDRAGNKQKIEGTKDVVLPAWTEDGTRLAYLEARGRSRYALVVAAVQK